MSSVSLHNIVKRFGAVTAVDDVSLDVADREFLTLLGPSGCGKTTTLNIIAGLESPSGGRVLFDNDDVTHVEPEKRNVSMVFQTYALYPHMNTRDNIAFGLRMRGVPREEIARRVDRAAAELELQSLLNRKPRELSGGQRQRVALARAIVRDSRVFLLDEPLSNLDAQLRVTMRTELKRMHYELERTFIYVTHDQAEALIMSDRIAVMNLGKIQQLGTPDEIYNRPANLFVARFIGSPPMNLIPGEIGQYNGISAFRCAQFTIPQNRLPARNSDRVVLGIRPEDIEIIQKEAADTASVTAQVIVTEPVGSDLFLTVECDGLVLKLRTRPDFKVNRGENVGLKFREERINLFDAESELTLTENSGEMQSPDDCSFSFSF